MATTNYRFAIQLQFVNDNLTDNADTLLIGDFTDKYIADDAKSDQFDLNNSRLLFVKDRHGSKVVTATDLLNQLKRFVANCVEVNTKSTYVTDPKVTFIVQTNDNHNMLTEDVIAAWHKEINENIDKFKPYILNVTTDGADYEVIPYASAGVVFTTMTIKTGVTAGNLAYLIRHLFEFVESENVNLINEFNTWFEKIYTQIENEAKQIVSNDKDLTDITSSVISFETYRQIIEDWYKIAVEYYNSKPTRYIIDTRGYRRDQIVAYRIYSAQGDNEKPVINLHMVTTPSLTSGIIGNYEAHMQVTRYGTMLKCTENTRTVYSPKPIPYLNDNGSTLRVPGNSVYHVIADSPYMRFDAVAVEGWYYWRYNTGVTSALTLQTFGQHYQADNATWGNGGWAKMYPAWDSRLAIKNQYNLGVRGHSHEFRPNGATLANPWGDGYMWMISGDGNTRMNKFRTSPKSGVMNLKWYDTVTGQTRYVPLNKKMPSETTLRVIDGYTGTINYLNKVMVTPQYELKGYGFFTGRSRAQRMSDTHGNHLVDWGTRKKWKNGYTVERGYSGKGWEFGNMKTIGVIPTGDGFVAGAQYNYQCVANVKIKYVTGPYATLSPVFRGSTTPTASCRVSNKYVCDRCGDCDHCGDCCQGN